MQIGGNGELHVHGEYGCAGLGRMGGGGFGGFNVDVHPGKQVGNVVDDTGVVGTDGLEVVRQDRQGRSNCGGGC